MKYLLAVVMAVLLAVGVTFAEGEGVKLELGAAIDYTISKDVDLENLGLTADLAQQDYDLNLAIKPCDWLTVTPKAGLSTAQYNDIADKVDVESGIGWNIGVDVKADVYTAKLDNDKLPVELSLIGAYKFSRIDIDEIDIGGLVINNPLEAIISSWDYELGAMVSADLAAYNIPITPYIGVVYSDLTGEADINLSVVSLEEDIKAEENIGLRLGLSGQPTKDISVGCDVRLLDETAVVGKVAYKF